MTQIFAHRGSSGMYPENTMRAFKEAEKTGCEGIELDVQRTKDGVLVVIHDEFVNRTTNGRGAVASLTLKEIKELDASYNKKTWFSHNRIPTLDEVFQWLQGNQLICNVELKNNKVRYRGMEEEVLQKIAAFKLDDRIILSSFNHQSIILLHELDPTASIAPIYSKKGVNPLLLATTTHACAVHANYRVMTQAQMESCQRAKVPVRLYTINQEPLLEQWMNMGVSGVITDFPERAMVVRNNLLN
ncbi:glycerophosphodiester phosphodiesterase [Jeotgalibacillus marinus]|uniref:Glycerophosphodiester phosphodiesterase n=1 Tax=Jeotgalibacillus marinus TaxID=86667 RepID=A0ABV3PZF4_9BACL